MRSIFSSNDIAEMVWAVMDCIVLFLDRVTLQVAIESSMDRAVSSEDALVSAEIEY